MAGGRGKRRRRAAKTNEDHEKSWWSNSIRVPLSPSNRRSRPFDGNAFSPSISQEGGAMLELSGLQSPTGTIFARIIRHLNESDSGRKDIENPKTKEVTEDSKTRSRDLWRVEDLVSTIVNQISLHEEATKAAAESEYLEGKTPRACVESSQSLLKLGSVWILDPASADRPQNKPVWKRLLKKEDDDRRSDIDEKNSIFWFDEFMTLRVHSHPTRYPMSQKFGIALKQQNLEDDGNPMGCSETIRSTGASLHGGIVYERAIENLRGVKDPQDIEATKLAFAVLNKPPGVPSHSTVDNAVENLLYHYQRFRKLDYASLPQRLDTETSGLVLVATHPDLATYFSKLLEQKSRTASKSITPTSTSSLPLVSSDASIQKCYRCLVTFPEDSLVTTQAFLRTTYIQTQKIVEHYVDANSRAPKTFVDADNFNESDAYVATATSRGGKEEDKIHTAGSARRWQLCKLRIRSMTIPKKPCKLVSELELASTGSLENLVCSELEIELLTGRTHQIRGQLAALGCPIFGDPLYGRAHAAERDWKDRSALRMALQCCELVFPVDPSIGCERASLAPRRKGVNPSNRPAAEARNAEEGAKIPEGDHLDGPSVASPDRFPRRLEFRLDSAWWMDA